MLRTVLIIASLLGPADVDGAAAAAEIKAALEREEFDRAIELAQEAFESTGSPSFLYVWGHAERLRGNCEAALALYGRVMASRPAPELSEYARKGIQICEGELENQPEPEPEPPPPPPSPAIDPELEAPLDERSGAPPPWWKDRLGLGLLAAGGTTTVAGAALLVSGDVVRRRAPSRTDEARYVDARESSASLTISGAVVGGVGVALLAGSLIRYAVISRRTTSAARVSPWLIRF